MGGVKRRAGLFVVDSAGYTCVVARSLPYDAAATAADVGTCVSAKRPFKQVPSNYNTTTTYYNNKTKTNKLLKKKKKNVEGGANVFGHHKKLGMVVTPSWTVVDSMGCGSGHATCYGGPVGGWKVEPAAVGRLLAPSTVTSDTDAAGGGGGGEEGQKDGNVECVDRRGASAVVDPPVVTAEVAAPFFTADATIPFLEMIQIPRGMKEKKDKDLLQTAVREFCEETLCANDPLHVLNGDPIKLYWDDDGKRWSYGIYVAKTETRLYFAFDPSLMRTVEFNVRGTSGVCHQYRLYMAAISRSRSPEAVYSRLVVMKVTDYLHYMRNFQLDCYGENNYSLLFDRLDKLWGGRADVVQSTVARGQDDNAVATAILPVSGRPADCPPAWATVPKECSTVSRTMYDSIKRNREVYVHSFHRSVYSTVCTNRVMQLRWEAFWNASRSDARN